MALLLLVCAFLRVAALIAAVEPARVHEARQGPIASVTILPFGPGPVSIQSSPTAETTTMPSSEPSSRTLSSGVSPFPSSYSSNSLLHSLSLSASSRTASATPQPSSSPTLDITVQNMTTCTSGVVSWNYSGNEAVELLLSVTNIGVDQTDYTLRRFKARESSVNTTILQQLVDTNTSAPPWTWPSVNLTQGWYKIQGLALASPNVSNDSAPFFIANGTNIACLTGTLTQASSTASPSASISPVSAASKSHVASIAGGVIGAIAAILLAIIAGIYLWSRKRKRHFVGDSLNRNRKWGSLKSTSSSIQPVVDSHTSDHFHSHTNSTATALVDVVVGQVTPSTTPDRSDEDVTTMGEEKHVSPASSHGITPFDALNTPVHFDRRTSVHHGSSPTTPLCEDSRFRTTSIHTNQTLEQQAQRIRSSMETSMRRRSERLSMPTLPSAGLTRLSHSPTSHTHTSSKEEYPLSRMTTNPVNRSISSGGMSMMARRTQRKPVPQYDPTLLQEDGNTDSVSTFTGGAESSHSHGTASVTGTTPTDLAHPAGFGDRRPVHYLIPDMPPPQQD